MKLIEKHIFSFAINKLIQNRLPSIFVLLNLIIAAIGFFRSFYLGQILNLSDLGYITLIQTGASAVGFLQFGLLSGGFRALVMRDESDFYVINNSVITFFVLLLVFLFGVVMFGNLFRLYTQFKIVYFAILIGFFSLLVNWITAVQFSKSRYLENNIFNLVSYISSFLFLLIWPNSNVTTTAIAILIQPILFLLLSVNYFKRFNLFLKYEILSGLLKIGFVTYLTTILGLMYIQVERWTINEFLGLEALGQLYLLFIIVTMWNLVPSSVVNITFAATTKAYKEKNLTAFKSITRKNLLILSSYSIIIILCILLLLEPFTNRLFNQHLPFIKYVYWALPGLALKTISEGFYSILSATLNLKAIFRMDILSFIFYSVSVGLLINIHSISLVNLIICFDLYCLFRFIYLFAECKFKSKLILYYFSSGYETS
jgi:O-antigen/teichoic acid export membrane protein